ncbi:hypothetical protein [Pseudomonas sp. M30-35]|uniref:hypothetical protein n=1 Tax=Pseudomonas sp. M30-35 TaxID=1981174 RepID=UPI000B3CCDB3|nr:hypothetical protein [Pseudomonas sp. M30-35]ARU90166.1 hypothetical protein B9K09_20400 [Pseudomonas sp. M30-35]
MIDFYSWHPYLRITFLLAPFVIALSGLAVQVYITHRYYDQVISAFPNSLGVRNYQRMWAGFDFISRCMQVGSTGGFVLWPNIHIRQGTLDPEEVRNFPPEIKRLMVIAWRLGFVGMAWLFLAVGLLKLSGAT